MQVEVITDADIPTSSLPFSPGLRVGEFVFVSGQASVDEMGSVVTDTFEGEMRRSLENLKKVLAGASLDLANVIQVRAYVDDPDDLVEYNHLYRDFFTEPFPARTTLTGCLGGKLKFEVEVVACATAARS